MCVCVCFLWVFDVFKYGLLTVRKIKCLDFLRIGGIVPNQVIARSELEVHREMFTE